MCTNLEVKVLLLRQAEYAAGVEAGETRGIEIGKQKTMIKRVKNLVNSNLSIEEIAEMLEEDVSMIQQLSQS